MNGVLIHWNYAGDTESGNSLVRKARIIYIYIMQKFCIYAYISTRTSIGHRVKIPKCICVQWYLQDGATVIADRKSRRDVRHMTLHFDTLLMNVIWENLLCISIHVRSNALIRNAHIGKPPGNCRQPIYPDLEVIGALSFKMMTHKDHWNLDHLARIFHCLNSWVQQDLIRNGSLWHSNAHDAIKTTWKHAEAILPLLRVVSCLS